MGAGIDVLLRDRGIGSEFTGCFRHQLHQSDGAFGRYRSLREPGLSLNNALHKCGTNLMFQSRRGNDFVQREFGRWDMEACEDRLQNLGPQHF